MENFVPLNDLGPLDVNQRKVALRRAGEAAVLDPESRDLIGSPAVGRLQSVRIGWDRPVECPFGARDLDRAAARLVRKRRRIVDIDKSDGG